MNKPLLIVLAFLFSDLNLFAQVVAPTAPVAPVVAKPPLPANHQEQLEQFIVAALTTNECGTFRKWLDSPRFSCLYEMTQCRDVVDSFCREVSDALKGLPIQPTLGPDNDKNANVTVIVLRLEEGDVKAWEIARKNPNYGRERVTKTPGYVSNSPILAKQTRLQRWQIQPQQGAQIQNGQFVHLPVGEDDSLKNQVFSYGLQSFAFSPVPDSNMDSLLSPYNPQHPRDPRHLTTFDKKLLRFAYQYVPAGASKDEIRALIMLHWDKMQTPAAASTPVAPVVANSSVPATKMETVSTPEITSWWSDKVSSTPNIGFHKWNKSFRISLCGQAVQCRAILTSFLEEVSPLLAGVKPILAQDNLPDADIIFIMGSKEELAAIRKTKQGSPDSDYHITYNPDQSINHLTIFFDSSIFTGEQPEKVRAQISQVFLRFLVFATDYPNAANVAGAWGVYQNGEMDKDLIAFIYANVPNGATGFAIKEIFHKWNSVAPVAPVADEPTTFTGTYDAVGMTVVNGSQVFNFSSKGVVGKSIRIFSAPGQPIEGYDGKKKCSVVIAPNKKDGSILLTLTYE